jgi:very-short-patch-repair endonuclease
MVTLTQKRKRKSRALNRTRAKIMRHDSVSTEDLFWSEVRNRKLGGFKFKRQYLIAPYIVDFVCLEKHFIVELDGKLHEGREAYDAARDAFLSRQGYDIYRIRNEEFAGNLPTILTTILHELTAPSPRPSPPLRGGEGERLE